MRLFIIAAALTTSFAFTAFADDSNQPDEAAKPDKPITSNDTFGTFGLRSSNKIDGKKCVITTSLDRATFVDKIPTLQRLQLLNEDITQTQINLQPNTLAMGFTVNVYPVVVQETYENNKAVDQCHFIGTLKIVDEYGQDKEIEMLSFDFTRAINDRVNWDKFQPTNLIKIARHFTFSPVMMLVVAKEKADE